MDPSVEKECKVFCMYLIECEPSQREIFLYKKALSDLKLDLTDNEMTIRKLCIRFPFLLKFADAGAALMMRNGNFRKRLIVMLSIVEASPDHCDKFIYDEEFRPKVHHFIWNGISSIILIPFGIFLIFFIKVFQNGK